MTRLEGTVALVTGASSGIGHATALELAREGASVAVVGGRKDRLTELAADITGAGGKGLVVAAGHHLEAGAAQELLGPGQVHPRRAAARPLTGDAGQLIQGNRQLRGELVRKRQRGDAARPAFEQFTAQVVLQRPELRGDGGLRQAQPTRSGGEGPQAGYAWQPPAVRPRIRHRFTDVVPVFPWGRTRRRL